MGELRILANLNVMQVQSSRGRQPSSIPLRIREHYKAQLS